VQLSCNIYFICITKRLTIGLDIYKRDYETFDVNQYNFTLSKGFKFDDLKLKATVIAKKININGSKYGGYIFKDKDYFNLAKYELIFNGFYCHSNLKYI